MAIFYSNSRAELVFEFESIGGKMKMCFDVSTELKSSLPLLGALD
jgi:hypothetical protein